MIKVGNILIDPNDISSVQQDLKSPISHTDRRFPLTQIVYKSGVVKNFTSDELGMSYSDFINTLMDLKEKEESDKIFRIVAAIKSATNG